MMNVVFMGTPDFAVSSLNALADAGYNILACVSQPDKPSGRHMELVPTPVKERAMELGIPVYQPEKASDPEFIELMRSLDPDVFVVTAYGKILRKALLDIPKYGCVNVHGSLLPRWRGAAPIQWAVIEGDEYSGVTTMLLDEGMDTGDILLKKEIKLSEDETGGSLFDKLSVLGGELLIETLKGMEEGVIKPVKQDDALATKASILTKEMGQIDWNRSALTIDRLIRGLSPWPGTFTHMNGKLLKIHKAKPVSYDELTALNSECDIKMDTRLSGDVIVCSNRLFVKCSEGILELLEVQPEGKKRMPASDFARGYSPVKFD